MLHPEHKKVIEPVCILPDGQELYRFKDPSDLPEVRRVLYADFYREWQDGISRNHARQLFQEIVKCLNAHDYSRAGYWAMTGLDLIDNCMPSDSLYHLASLMYFTLEEPIYEYDYTYAELKIEQMKKLPATDFFLPSLLKYLGQFKQASLKDIQNTLLLSELKVKAHMRLLGEATASGQ